MQSPSCPGGEDTSPTAAAVRYQRPWIPPSLVVMPCSSPGRARIEAQGDGGFPGLARVQTDRSGTTSHRILLDLECVDRSDGRAVLVEHRHHAPDLPISKQLDAGAIKGVLDRLPTRHPHPLAVFAVDDPE